MWASAWSCPKASRSATSRTLCFSSKPRDRVLGGHAALDELEARPQDVAEGPQSQKRLWHRRRSCALRAGDRSAEDGPAWLRVCRVRLDLGRCDRLDAFGVSEVEVDTCGPPSARSASVSSDPVPARRALDGGGVPSPGLLREVGQQRLGAAGHLGELATTAPEASSVVAVTERLWRSRPVK